MMPKTQYIKMRNFMLENHIGINSRHGLFEWAKIIARKNNGKCPCNPKTRLECPCIQAIPEINQTGFCACKLFGVNEACNDCKYNCKLKFTYLPNNQE